MHEASSQRFRIFHHRLVRTLKIGKKKPTNNPTDNPSFDKRNIITIMSSTETPGTEYELAPPIVSQENRAGGVARVKQGHKCCGGCCDMRRAVIIVNIVNICLMGLRNLAMAFVWGMATNGRDSNAITFYHYVLEVRIQGSFHFCPESISVCSSFVPLYAGFVFSSWNFRFHEIQCLDGWLCRCCVLC